MMEQTKYIHRLLKKISKIHFFAFVMLLFLTIGGVFYYRYYPKVVEEDIVIRFFYIKKSCDSDKWWNAETCNKYRVMTILKSDHVYDQILNKEIKIEYSAVQPRLLFKKTKNTNKVFFVFSGDMRMNQKNEYIFYIKKGYTEPFIGQLKGVY